MPLTDAQWSDAVALAVSRFHTGVTTADQMADEITAATQDWPTRSLSNSGLVIKISRSLASLTGLIETVGPPDPEAGTLGAMAFDNQALAFYGPKTELGWGDARPIDAGPPGPAIEMQVSGGFIQWRVVGDTAWINLIDVADLKGADGQEVELRKTATHIQWRLGIGAWTDLVSLADLKGPQGDKGDTGDTGNAAWSPVFAVVADGERRVQRIVDWTGGQGPKPATGKYLGPAGLVDTAAEATDIRGASGPGTGDVLAANNLSDLTDKGAARLNLGVIPATGVGGATDLGGAITAMEAAKGFVRFHEGEATLDASVTLGSALFEGGASVFVPAGMTLTVNERINAPRQQIFYGPGNVLLNHEASHYVCPEWFGAFPNRPAVDAGLLLQKISDSVVAGRECLIDFGPGTYYLQTSVTWSRACRILGSGDRLTHFRVSLATGDVFTCAGQGVQFEGIQFSCPTKRTSGAYINLNAQYSSARRIWLTDGFEGVTLSAGQCVAEGVTGSSWSNATGTSLVLRKGGDDGEVRNVAMLSSGADAPQRIVHVHPTSAALRYGSVENIRGRGVGTALVEVHADVFDVEYVKVKAVTGKGGTGSGVILRSTAGNMRSCSVDGVDINTMTGDGVLIIKDGAGAMSSITIGRHDLRVTGDGMKVDASSGSVQGVSIGAGVTRNCGGNGYNLKAVGLSVVGIQARSNTGTGILLPSGAATYHVLGVAEFNGTNVSHPSDSGSICNVVVP